MNILLNGACGRMGAAVAEAVKSSDSKIVAGVDVFQKPAEFPIYSRLEDVKEDVDVIIDFSNHISTEKLVNYCREKHLPVVISTTGHTEEELNMIQDLAKEVPVFHSGNMSLGVNTLISLCQQATKILGGRADIEIIEKHHNQKLDAPSGTAIMIAESIREMLPEEYEFVYDRTGRRMPRPKKEIGISSIRGGNIVGEHEVMFIFGNEILSVKHTAMGRAIFADGALQAAKYLLGKPAGMYSMKEMLNEEIASV